MAVHRKASRQRVALFALGSIFISALCFGDTPTTLPSKNIFDFDHDKPEKPVAPETATPPAAPAETPALPQTPPAEPKNADAQPSAQPQPPTAEGAAPASAPLTKPTPPAAAAAVVKRLAVPSQQEQADASKLIDEVHAADITAAKTPEQKSALSSRIFKEATDETHDLSAKFMLFKRSIDLAAGGDDLAGAEKIAIEMAKVFDIDSTKLTVAAANTVLKSLTSSAECKNFAEETELLVSDARTQDRLDLAVQLNDVSLAAAKLAKQSSLVSEITANGLQLSAARAVQAKVKLAEAVLSTNPEYPAANLEVGKYRCYYLNDWETGIPLLARCGDANLKKLASAELVANPEPAAQLAVGDGWWQSADAETGEARQHIQSHALSLYRKVLPDLTGLSKMKVERRIADAATQPVASSSGQLSKLFRAEATEYSWAKKDTDLSIMSADSGFCLLSEINAHLEGYGESAGVELSADNQWVSSCQTHQEHMCARFLGYKAKSNYKSQVTFFNWKKGDSKVKMIYKDQGLCFLSGLTGHFAGNGEEVHIDCEADGYWYLNGASGQNQLGGTAVAIKLNDPALIATAGRVYTWKAGEAPVRLIANGKGIVGLVGIGGRLGGEGNQAGLRLDKDGFWYLDGKAPFKQLWVKAAVFKFSTAK